MPATPAPDVVERLRAAAITLSETAFYPGPISDLVDEAADFIEAQSRIIKAHEKEHDECQQIAGKALGYPWYKDDQKNFPGTTEENGVCIGEHTTWSIVTELARAYLYLKDKS